MESYKKLNYIPVNIKWKVDAVFTSSHNYIKITMKLQNKYH